MRFRERLASALLAIVVLILCFPFAVLLTIATAPFWSWLEARFAIEAYGRSGPAPWCYAVSCAGSVAAATTVWSRIRARRKNATLASGPERSSRDRS